MQFFVTIVQSFRLTWYKNQMKVKRNGNDIFAQKILE